MNTCVFMLRHKWQTHSLSMVKQVTGPSAVQVAVLKTSLKNQNVKPGNTDLFMAAQGEHEQLKSCGSCHDLGDGDTERSTVCPETLQSLHGCKCKHY